MSDGLVDTVGRMKLAAWMAEAPRLRSRGAIARSLGISQPAVSAYLRGLTRPEPRYRTGLKELVGCDADGSWILPESDWETVDERHEAARVVQLARRANLVLGETPEPKEGKKATGTDG